MFDLIEFLSKLVNEVDSIFDLATEKILYNEQDLLKLLGRKHVYNELLRETFMEEGKIRRYGIDYYIDMEVLYSYLFADGSNELTHRVLLGLVSKFAKHVDYDVYPYKEFTNSFVDDFSEGSSYIHLKYFDDFISSHWDLYDCCTYFGLDISDVRGSISETDKFLFYEDEYHDYMDIYSEYVNIYGLMSLIFQADRGQGWEVRKFICHKLFPGSVKSLLKDIQ